MKQMELAEQVELRETQPRSLTLGVGSQPIGQPVEGSHLHSCLLGGTQRLPNPLWSLFPEGAISCPCSA